MNNLLTVTNLSKRFDHVQGDFLWKEISFVLDIGETISICGESGSGKSTLLFALGGLEPVQSGQIFFKNQPIVYRQKAHIPELSYIFQHYYLIDELTIAENIMLSAQVAFQKNIKEYFYEIVEVLGLKMLLSQLPFNLSGGERQRVAIARALITQPKLLLADEPTGSLDEKTGRCVMDLFFNVCERFQTSFILVTHNLQFAARAHRQFYLKEGRLIYANH